MGKTGTRLAALDGLRAVFGLGLIVYHTGDLFGCVFPQVLGPVYRYGGYWGNYIFFSISGFLTALHYRERIMKGTCGFPDFFRKRLLRIYPVYFLSNIARILLGGVTLTPKRTLGTFLMISSGWFWRGDTPYNLHAWFICVLMACYILYFAIGKISSRFHAAYPALCGALIVWGAVLEVMDWDLPFQYRVSGEGYMNFFLGVMLAELYRFLLAGDRQRRRAIRTACYALGGTGVLAILLFGYDALPGDMRWWITLIGGALIMSALSGGAVSRVCSLPLLQPLGQSCLSLTLWHGPLALAFRRVASRSGMGPETAFALYLILAIAAAVLSCRYLERAFYSRST